MKSLFRAFVSARKMNYVTPVVCSLGAMYYFKEGKDT